MLRLMAMRMTVLASGSRGNSTVLSSSCASILVDAGISCRETLKRMHNYYREEGSRKLHALAQWMPRFVFLFVALMIGWYVIRFWAGYFKQIQDAGGF